MKTTTLATDKSNLCLITPDVERDSPLGVEWLKGDIGRETLKLMGVADKDNTEKSLEHEQGRVQGFIENKAQLNWMIEFDGQIVGSVWADLEDSEFLKSPSVHIMIGDPNVRGKGVGNASIEAVMNHLQKQGYQTIYSRYLLINKGSQKLLAKIGFIKDGQTYQDADGLEWQNVIYLTRRTRYV